MLGAPTNVNVAFFECVVYATFGLLGRAPDLLGARTRP